MNRSRHRLLRASWLVAVLALYWVGVAPAGASSFAYVANAGFFNVANSASVSQYSIGGDDKLSPLSPPTVFAGEEPFGVAVSPNDTSAYVTDARVSRVFQFSIDSATGGLVPNSPPAVPAGSGPSAVVVTPDGKSAYVVNGAERTIGQYSIDPVSGKLAPKTPATVATGVNARAIAVTPDGRSAYVVSESNGALPGFISEYTIDPSTGTLSPKTPATVPAGNLATGIAVSPNGRSAYVTNFLDRTVSQYNVDPATGELSPKSPATVPTGVGPDGVVVNPNGKSAYVSNEGTGFGGSVSQFSIDASSGALSPKTPAEVSAGAGGAPVFVAMAPDGKAVYVSVTFAPSPGFIVEFSVDPVTGALSPIGEVPAGVGPHGIAVTPLPRAPTSKAQCKNGGWRNFPQFKNQGDCVSFVEAGK